MNRRLTPHSPGSCRILLSNYETAVPFSISDTEIVSFFREQGLGDGFCCWLDHMHGTQDPPDPRSNEDLIVTFFPNNPYYPLRARQRDMSLEEYTDLRMTQMEELLNTAGERFHCCIGWETYQPAHWCQSDGSAPSFQTPQEAFAFFRRWLRTSIHHRHWRDCQKFQADYPIASAQPSMLELLENRNENPADWNLIVGNNCPGLAHATFEGMPEAKAFWWECLHSATVAMQVGMPFVRGAARQYQKRWLCDVAPYSGPFPEHPEEYYRDMGEWGELEGAKSGAARPRINHPRYTAEMTRLGGYSPELALRCWITALLGGCDWLFQEASSVTHLIKLTDGSLKLTPYGQAARNLADFNRRVKDRGRPWTPVTLLMDPYHGIDPHHTQNSPWYWMDHTPGSRQVAAFFEAAYPGHGRHQQDRWPWNDLAEYSSMLLEGRDLRDVEQKHLLPGRWADLFDVLTTAAPNEAFQDSSVLILLGPHSSQGLDADRLRAWIEQGRTLIATAGTLATPPDFFPQSKAECVTRNGWVDDSGKLHQSTEYHYAPLPEDSGDVLFTTDRGEPLATRRTVGCGALVFVSVPSGLDTKDQLAAPLLGLLDALCEEHFPFAIQGPPLQRACTIIDGGHLLLLVNHEAENWLGTVRIKNGPVDTVRDLWRDSEVAIEKIDDAHIALKPEIPPYGFVVLEVKYSN
jgi:hypothetical protein